MKMLMQSQYSSVNPLNQDYPDPSDNNIRMLTHTNELNHDLKQ